MINRKNAPKFHAKTGENLIVHSMVVDRVTLKQECVERVDICQTDHDSQCLFARRWRYYWSIFSTMVTSKLDVLSDGYLTLRIIKFCVMLILPSAEWMKELKVSRLGTDSSSTDVSTVTISGKLKDSIAHFC